jgi:hypothetical protein
MQSSEVHGRDDVPTTPPQTDAGDVQSIYQALVRGVGREHVSDANVDELIRRAEADGHSMLATELREWRAPCGDGSNRTAAR